MIHEWDLTSKREQVYNVFSQARAELHDWLQDTAQEFQGLFGLDLSKPNAPFEVHSLRPARRVGPDGQLLVELVIELTQQKSGYLAPACRLHLSRRVYAAGRSHHRKSALLHHQKHPQ
jgi:hypothetical protein